MKVEWRDTDDPEKGGNFIIWAESAIEGAILRRFSIAAQSNRMWLHGSVYSFDLGYTTSINLGLLDLEERRD